MTLDKKRGYVVMTASTDYRAPRAIAVEKYTPFCSSVCGICESPGAGTFWFNHVSQLAHSTCFQAITPIERTMCRKINESFDKYETNLRGDMGVVVARSCQHISAVHEKAIEAIRAACGEKTIAGFLETYGEEALTTLFNTVGISEVERIKRSYSRG